MKLPLVLNPATLAELPADAGIRLIDVRSAQRYAAGHIPGAVPGDTTLLNRNEPPAQGLLPEATIVTRLIQSTGIQADQPVVVYDDGAETAAARMVWLLHTFGISQAVWLNGGFRAWQAIGGAESTDTPTVEPGTADVQDSGRYRLTADELLCRLEDPDLVVFDVRSLAEYRGEDVRAAMGGHVPGAVHQNWVDTLGADGRLLDDSSLLAALAERGITPDKHVVVYCQSHQRSSVTWVMLRHLGFERVSALDGAWSVWGNRSDLPKAR